MNYRPICKSVCSLERCASDDSEEPKNSSSAHMQKYITYVNPLYAHHRNATLCNCAWMKESSSSSTKSRKRGQLFTCLNWLGPIDERRSNRRKESSRLFSAIKTWCRSDRESEMESSLSSVSRVVEYCYNWGDEECLLIIVLYGKRQQDQQHSSWRMAYLSFQRDMNRAFCRSTRSKFQLIRNNETRASRHRAR